MLLDSNCIRYIHHYTILFLFFLHEYYYIHLEHFQKKKKMDAMFMGLGDIVIPGSLAVSAFTFLVADGPTLETTIVAAATIVGGLIGFLALMRYVLKGNPQAGLPLLNTGAILGFAISYFIFFGV